MFSGTWIIWFRPNDLGSSLTEVIRRFGTRASEAGGASGFGCPCWATVPSKGEVAVEDEAVADEEVADEEADLAAVGSDRLCPGLEAIPGGGVDPELELPCVCRSVSRRNDRAEWKCAGRAAALMRLGRRRAPSADTDAVVDVERLRRATVDAWSHIAGDAWCMGAARRSMADMPRLKVTFAIGTVGLCRPLESCLRRAVSSARRQQKVVD